MERVRRGCYWKANEGGESSAARPGEVEDAAPAPVADRAARGALEMCGYGLHAAHVKGWGEDMVREAIGMGLARLAGRNRQPGGGEERG